MNPVDVAGINLGNEGCATSVETENNSGLSGLTASDDADAPRMPAATRTALEGSIEKWEKIVDGTGADYGTENCPLCTLFYDGDDWSICTDCPVRASTGLTGCDGTPYLRWSQALTKPFSPWFADTPELKSYAQAELDFLRSLLPQSAPLSGATATRADSTVEINRNES